MWGKVYLRESRCASVRSQVTLKSFRDGPTLVVASGRDTIAIASSIKKLVPDNVFLVQV